MPRPGRQLDPLTGLPNRRYFEEYVELLGRGRRAADAIGILMVDVDRFKVLNDRFGHAVGDVVLRAIGRAIASPSATSTCRPASVARSS